MIMKRIAILFLFVLAVATLSAQNVPQTVNFSAMLRDSVGNILSDTSVSLYLILREGGANGVTVYTTQTTTTTNANGYVSVMLNRGLSSNGMPFTQIPWENGDFWIQVDYKTDDMSNYRTQGCYELTSNFYAFVAGKANRLEGIDFDAENPENGDALIYNSETGRFEARALIPPRAPALSTVLEAGNDAGGMNISNLGAPVDPNDIVTKEYADSIYHRIVTAITNINCSHNGHEYIDLGLPSGTLWAKCNVGAATPESPGDFYAWGEVMTKDRYDTDNYIFTGSCDTLPAEYDAASVYWGGGWRMPTYEEMKELMRYCAWKHTVRDGMAGYLITGSNGYSIFMPYAGRKVYQYWYNLNSAFQYRCSGRWITDCLTFESIVYYSISMNRNDDLSKCFGYPIRPVLNPNDLIER